MLVPTKHGKESWISFVVPRQVPPSVASAIVSRGGNRRMATQHRRHGRPSETYPPERRSMRFENWPKGDQLAFERARQVGDAFELPGPAAHWSRETCRSRVQAYGKVLNIFSMKDLLLESEGPADRITPARRNLLIAELRHQLSPLTLA